MRGNLRVPKYVENDMSQIFFKVGEFLAYVHWRRKVDHIFSQHVRYHGNQENLFLAYFDYFFSEKGNIYSSCTDKPLSEI